MAASLNNQTDKKIAPKWDVAETKRIVLENLSPYAVSVYLFGSHASNTMVRSSDIDVAVLSNEPLPTGLLSDIRDKLEDSHILYSVDLVDLSEVSQIFKDKVMKEGVIWKG